MTICSRTSGAALSAGHADQVIFFGGTATARTHLPPGRLSEDIDLIAADVRRDTAAAIEQALDRALRSSHGKIIWAPGLSAVRDTDAVVRLADEGRLAVRMQLLHPVGYPPWPTGLHAIQQRYSDAGPATLRVPTAASSAAWKTIAWPDRPVPRDLWDLWGRWPDTARSPSARRSCSSLTDRLATHPSRGCSHRHRFRGVGRTY